MKSKILLTFIPLMLLINYNLSAQEKGDKKIVYEKNYIKTDDSLPDDLVPNKQTAIKIAEAVWLPIYGKEIFTEKPFIAELTNGVWIVKGTVHATKGGAAYIEIRKNNCEILKIFHEK